MKHLWRIIKFARELWPVFIAISLLTVLSAALGQVAPLLIRQIVDGIAESLPGTADLQPLLWLVAGIFLASLASILVGNLGGYLGDMMAIRLERILTASYSTHLTKLPQTYFDNQQTGSIVSRLTRAVTTIKSFLNVFANNFLSTFANLIFGLGVVAYFYWPAALIMISIYPIYYFFTERSSRHWQKIQKKINDIIDGAYGRLNQVIGQLKVVRAFGRENSETKLLDKQLSKVVGLTRRQSRHWHRQDIYRRILADSLSFLVLAIVVGQAAAGRFSLGTLVLFITYILQLRFPLFAMSFLVDNAQRAIAGSREFFEVLAVEPAAADPPGAKNLKIAGGAIRFEGVDFGYDKNRTVLTDISFDLPAGGKLALVGESGQGKTTVVNLLLGLYKPEAGRIIIDGQDIATVKQRSLRSAIGTVFQDASLFAGTVRQNILYGRPSASEEAMIKAAKAANAHDFIQKLPKGYDTAIGERGIRLSGGQQQRVAIARAILDDPPILLLDEATSSLDSKAEAQVQEALDRLMKNRTTIIIAHRLSTIASVDFIVTLSGGRVDEIGPPNKLAQTGGIYGQLLDLQNANPQKRRRILKKYDLAN